MSVRELDLVGPNAELSTAMDHVRSGADALRELAPDLATTLTCVGRIEAHALPALQAYARRVASERGLELEMDGGDGSYEVRFVVRLSGAGSVARR